MARPLTPLALGASAVALAALSRGAAAQPSTSLIMPNVIISPDALRAMGASGRRPETYAEEISQWCNFFDITTRSRVAHFLGQTFHESTAMANMRELPSSYVSSRGRYSGRGLIQLTGSNQGSGPGNYAAYRNYLRTHSEVPYIDCVARPGLVEEMPHSVHSAGWYWGNNNMNELCEDAVTTRTILRTSICIACGRGIVDRGASTCTYSGVQRAPNGLADRTRRVRLAESIIDQGLVTFTMSPAPGVPGSTENPVMSIIKNGARTVKAGGAARPSDTLALFKEGAAGKQEINPTGVAGLAVLAGAAFILSR